MGGIFNIDGPLFQGLAKLVDIVFLSILWVVFSIPLFTIGASTSALYATANKVLRHERNYVFNQFWTSFKSCFKQSTLSWIVFVLIVMLLLGDIRILKVMFPNASLSSGMQLFFTIMLIIIVTVFIYVFSYVARFSTTWKNMMKNSFIIAFRHLPMSILLLVWTAIILLAIWIIPITVFCLPSIWGLISSLILERIFRKYMSDEDREHEDLLNRKRY